MLEGSLAKVNEVNWIIYITCAKCGLHWRGHAAFRDPAPARRMTDLLAPPGVPLDLPLYRDIAAQLRGALADGEWKPGAAIPAERRLATRFGVSIGTLRKAIDELVAANLLIRQQGRGTFVASHTRDRLLFYFFHVVPIEGTKRYPDVRLVSFARGKADRSEADRLRIGTGAPVFRIRNLLHLDQQPIILDDLTLPAAR